MTRRARSLVVFIFFVVLPLTGWAQQIQESDDGYTATVNKTFAVKPGGTLDLEATNGSITVTGGDRTDVVVEETIRLEDASREEATEYLDEHATRYEQTDDTVRIRGPKPNGGSWWGSDDDVQYRYRVQVPRQFSTQLQTSGGSLTITDLEGSVQGTTAGGSVTTERITGDVQVRTAGGSLALREIDGQVQGRTAGGSIEAEDVSGPLNVRTAGGSIRVREVDDSVTAKTAGGSVQVERVDGSVDARTSGGDVTVRGVAQKVRAKTSGGDIELRDLGGPVTAETSGGDIEGDNLRGAVDARTSAGDVELENVAAPITARTSVGDVEIEITATSFSTDPAVQLRTSHGDIELTLPPTLPASIRAKVEGYGGMSGDEEIRSDVPLTREGGNGEPLRATGTMNGGGPTIELETSGGSIRIEHGE
ncbi:MAG TPA: DUF4097 family beta strand repeat-containing protein [Salinibacter sp.]|nr:DUF4097 family beta strand repeat-containing protein [Salinibacter sp.]